MSDYKKLKNQPLKFVLAEFQFTKFEKISQLIPELQEAYRGEYPDYSNPTDMATPNLFKINMDMDGVAVTNNARWLFKSVDRKESITVLDHKIVLSTARYDRFEDLSSSCMQMLEIFEDLVKPGILKRVGLRYGDLVLEQENELLEDCVDSRFLPSNEVRSFAADDWVQHTTETAVETKFGLLVIKSIYGPHNLVTIPDLRLGLKMDNPSSSGNRLVLDFDHFWKEKPEDDAIPFEASKAIEILGSLHDISREAFWKLTTDHARNEIWA